MGKARLLINANRTTNWLGPKSERFAIGITRVERFELYALIDKHVKSLPVRVKVKEFQPNTRLPVRSNARTVNDEVILIHKKHLVFVRSCDMKQ